MKIAYNELVKQHILSSVVCGIICEGDDILTYSMDMASPKLYRMIRIAKVKLFRSMEELHFLPQIIFCLMQLKNIALETALKAETSSIEAAENGHRNAPIPPTAWLSFDSRNLSCKRKRNHTDQ
ncbi:hypothetical protein EDC96DRAFT_346174 [Choanephora cucurbitarum]|nr:hypothetical protein EDC96DRAFT_346174 [Choanephora cucurbitarum]